MKTIVHEYKVLRIIILLLFSFASIFLISEFYKGEIKDEGRVAITLATVSAIAGIMLGYILVLGIIRRKIVNCFDNEIKFSTNGTTVVSGKLTVITKGLKIKHILLEDETFKVEEEREKIIHEELVSEDLNFTLLIGDFLPKRTKAQKRNMLRDNIL